MKTHVANGGPRIIPLSPNGMFGLSDLASMATNLTQNKPSEGFRRFGLAKMTARMDGPTPFQASKWFQLACMATMLTPNKPSEAFRRFGLATMTAWMYEQRPCCHCMVVSIGSDAQHWVSDQTSSSLEEVETISRLEWVWARPSMLSSWPNQTF